MTWIMRSSSDEWGQCARKREWKVQRPRSEEEEEQRESHCAWSGETEAGRVSRSWVMQR